MAETAPTPKQWFATVKFPDLPNLQDAETRVLENFVVTTPNMPEIPEIFLPRFNGPEELRARADGRFGFQDPINAPQEFDRKLPHLSCFTRMSYQPQAISYAGWESAVSFEVENNDYSRGVGTYDRKLTEALSREVTR